MIGLFLDDERVPADVTWVKYCDSNIDWVIVRTQKEFIAAIVENSAKVELISFDHDLQDFAEDGEEMTGYTCIKWLIDHCMDSGMKLPNCVFHTQNPIGRGNMESYYLNAKRHLS